MIVDDIDERFTVAMAGAGADRIDLQWNLTVGAVPQADGRRSIFVQVVLSCSSPLVGQRCWEAVDVPIGVFLAGPDQLRKVAFDFVQQMQAIRQAVLQGGGS